MVMGNALWHLVKQSDAMSLFVLLSLLVLSIICWAVFFYKVLMIRMKKQQLDATLAQMKTITTPEQLADVAVNSTNTIGGYFLSRNLTFLKKELEKSEGRQLTKDQWELIECHMYQTVDDMLLHEEDYLSVFSMCAPVAPLIGLFGTVWGLIHAFIRISEKQSADIATVAPGIAEALIATLAGLVVAIPALIMFSYLTTQIRGIEKRLSMLADRFGLVIQQRLLR